MQKQDFLTRYRGWIIFLIVLPVSFVYQKLSDLSNWYYRTFVNSDKYHNERVSAIRDKVKNARQAGRKLRTARAPWKTMSIRKVDKRDYEQIPLNLRNILSIDTDHNILRVEPMATMGDITHYLVKRGYALAVQVEMDDLTVGGLCMGIGIETSSHRYGFLFETIHAYEIITAEGELIRATASENADLYHGLPMSHGTLGFLTAVELKIVPVKKYMKVRYIPFHDLGSFCKELERLTISDYTQFTEGLIFSASSGVIMTGELAEEIAIDGRFNAINRWYKPWFYTHAEKFLATGESVEYIPLRHYYHRHTSSIFFQLRDLIPFANDGWYRWLFAWLGAPKVSLMKYSMNKELRRRSLKNRVAQDIIIPLREMSGALSMIDQDFGIYPLWICPVRIYDKKENEGFIRNPLNDLNGKIFDMFVDIGIYGIPPAVGQGSWNAIKTARKLERFTADKGGFHMLYADIFMTKKEFEKMFNHNLYRRLREKYGAISVFPEVYEKVIPEKWLIDLESVVDAPKLEKEESRIEEVAG